MTARALGAVFMIAAWGVACSGFSSASVVEIGGSQYGNGRFEWSGLFTTTGTFIQFRLPTPTVYTLSDRTNVSVPTDWGIDVRNGAFGPAQWSAVLVNEGYSNSATFVQVVNPTPGSPYSFYIFYDMHATNVVDAYGLTGDVPLYSHQSTYYTNPTSYIDSGSPQVGQALNAALTDSRWSAGTFAGNRGPIEKIALQIRALTYGSRTPNTSTTLASTIWTNRAGDCDDLVKLQVAMLRRHGIPARVALTTSLGSPPNGLPIGTTPPTFHATGAYWGGDEWESFEAAAFENFAGADNMILGQDEDFTFLYPFRVGPPNSYPFSLLSESFTPSLTDWSGGGNFVERDRRNIGPLLDLYAQQVDETVPQRIALVPNDDTRIYGLPVSVAPRRALESHCRLDVSNPSRGSAALGLTGAWAERVRVEVMDVHGRCLKRSEARVTGGLGRARVDLAGLAPGVYAVLATDGRASSSAKVVVLK